MSGIAAYIPSMSAQTSEQPRLHEGQPGGGRFTFKPLVDAPDGLLDDPAEIAEEARRVYVSAQERAQQATRHARRAGVNLLALMIQARYPHAASVNLRWADGGYEADTVQDEDGNVLWNPATPDSEQISDTASDLKRYFTSPDDGNEAGIISYPDGHGVLPLPALSRDGLGDIELLLS